VEDLPPVSGSALASGGAVSGEDPEAELDRLVGLTEVKDVAHRLATEAKADVLRVRAGMKPTEQTRLADLPSKVSGADGDDATPYL
jgi:hypothetical protein